MTSIFRIFLFPLLLLAFTSAVTAQVPRALDRHAYPDFSFATPSSGEQAIRMLGARLSEVANWYGMEAEDLSRILREDSTAWLDQRGRLFYTDSFSGGTVEADDASEGAIYPQNQTFLMNSRAGANRVVYLDFDGYSASARTWNSGDFIEAPPYDTDGDDTSFNSEELAAIQQIWRQVAEDFAPFQINVTTQDPGQDAITRGSNNDQVFGTRVVVTRDSFLNCGCGAMAYLRVFDDIGDVQKPAFVFTTTRKGIAEAITHVAGHNLGLNHYGLAGTDDYYRGHGDGDTGWAPIMGAGQFRHLVQWSSGDYPNANRVQDDIQLIQSYGAPLVGDDHGDSMDTATSVDSTGDGFRRTIYTNGVIHRRDDADVFRIVSAAGDYNITIEPAQYNPNLDIRARFFDSNGELVASSNPAARLSATLIGKIKLAGEYFLVVDGAGLGDPAVMGYSDYGSLGYYSVSGSFADARNQQVPVASISSLSLSGYAPLSVGVDGSGSSDADGSIGKYSWSFGEGASGAGPASGNVYYQPGHYVASLQVTDDSGLSATASVNIVVINQVPSAVATADIATGTSTVAFHGSNSHDPDMESGEIVSWRWDFGDGGNSSEADPSHTYLTSGDFIPSLTVTDNHGASDTISLGPISIAASDLESRSAASQGPASRAGELPAGPVALVVTGGASATNVLNWTDVAPDEDGYRLARSVNGGVWDNDYRILASNVDSFIDVELRPGTTYSYRVAAYNSVGDSPWTEAQSAATPLREAHGLSLAAAAFKQQGVRYASLVWSDTAGSQVDVYRNLELVATVPGSGMYMDEIGGMGGGSFSYEVCEHGAADCSDAVTILF